VSPWIDRLTLSQRKLLFAVVAAGLIGLGVVSLLTPVSGSAGRGTTRNAPSTSAPALPTAPSARDNPVAVEGLDANKAALQLPDDQVAAAQAVAERFCQEYATRRWDEPPSARLARLAPFMGSQLAATFAESPGGAALEDERRATHEVTTAKPEFSYPQTISRQQVVFTVVVLQRVMTSHGATEQRPSFQVVLEPHDGTWRVVNVVA
jgi:hypothetical protein